MRLIRASAFSLYAACALGTLGGVSGAAGERAAEVAARLPTYTGVYEMYATIALLPVAHFEYQAILKPGRPPLHLDVTRIQGPQDRLLGKTVRAHGRYQWGTNLQGQRVRYMVVQRIEVLR